MLSILFIFFTLYTNVIYRQCIFHLASNKVPWHARRDCNEDEEEVWRSSENVKVTEAWRVIKERVWSKVSWRWIQADLLRLSRYIAEDTRVWHTYQGLRNIKLKWNVFYRRQDFISVSIVLKAMLSLSGWLVGVATLPVIHVIDMNTSTSATCGTGSEFPEDMWQP